MKVAWLFPGQGAQHVGMGKDVFDASPAARSVFQRADAALSQPLSALCFEGPMEELTLTANTQPAILTTSVALLAAVRERFGDHGIRADCGAGHSLGEYSALVAASALDLGDAVRICRLRGAAMQDAVAPGRGAMAAVMNLDGESVSELCREASERASTGSVSPANYNAPSQTVIAGDAEVVKAAMALAKERGGKAIPLKVSAPFHCALMAPARSSLAQALENLSIEAPGFDVLANVDAEPKPAPDDIRAALVSQVDSPVQWVRTIHQMRARGVTRALEIGPGRVLAGLVKRIDRDLEVLSVNGLEAMDKIPSFLGLED